MTDRTYYEGIENDAGTHVEFYSEPMGFDGEDWESVDLEPESGYALYRDLAATIMKVGNNLGAILQSADRYTADDD